MSLIYYLTQVKIDFGVIASLADGCSQLGITRPLVVSDAGVRQAGVLQAALDALNGVPHVTYDQTPSNPATLFGCYVFDCGDYGVNRDTVFALAAMLGSNEDFDGLVTAVEDIAAEQESRDY